MRRIIEKVWLALAIALTISYGIGCRSSTEPAGSTDAKGGGAQKTLTLEISGTPGLNYSVTVPDAGATFEGAAPGSHEIKGRLGNAMVFIVDKKDAEGALKVELKQAGIVLAEGSTSDAYGRVMLTGGPVRDELLKPLPEKPGS